MQSCPKQDLPTAITAHEPINVKKNSDLDSIPYDYNRVKLEPSGIADISVKEDYINASRVDMPSGQRFIV